MLDCQANTSRGLWKPKNLDIIRVVLHDLLEALYSTSLILGNMPIRLAGPLPCLALWLAGVHKLGAALMPNLDWRWLGVSLWTTRVCKFQQTLEIIIHVLYPAGMPHCIWLRGLCPHHAQNTLFTTRMHAWFLRMLHNDVHLCTSSMR